jgi:hypothetical protein
MPIVPRHSEARSAAAREVKIPTTVCLSHLLNFLVGYVMRTYRLDHTPAAGYKESRRGQLKTLFEVHNIYAAAGAPSGIGD